MKETLHIYTRVSSVGQEDNGSSLLEQRNLGIEMSKKLGFEYKVWDEGGKSSRYEDLKNRPILSELINEIEDKKVNHVFVYNTDRLSRNEECSFYIKSKLKKNEVTLYTNSGVTKLISPQENLIFTILSSIGQYDNELRTERVRRGRFRKVEDGNWKGGPPTFGYKLKEKKLVVDKTESEWVKTIFEMYSKKKSTMEIKQVLDSNGIMTRRNKPYWSLGSIQKILSNTTYIGRTTYHDKFMKETIDVKTPRIISDELFGICSKRTKKFVERRPQINNTKYFYLLRDIMVCGHCGTPISGTIRKSRYHKVYYCPRKERVWKEHQTPENLKWKRGHRCTMTKSLNITKTDDLIWKTVLRLIRKSHTLKEEFRTELITKVIHNRKNNSTEIKKYEKYYKKLLRELENIEQTISKFETDLLLKKHSSNKKGIRKNLEKEKLRVQKEIEQNVKTREDIQEQVSWVDWLKEFDQDILKKEKFTDTEKKDLLTNLVDQITVMYDPEENKHSLKIKFILPIVGDSIIFKDESDHRKGWDIKKGKTTKTLVHKLNQNTRIQVDPKKKFGGLNPP